MKDVVRNYPDSLTPFTWCIVEVREALHPHWHLAVSICSSCCVLPNGVLHLTIIGCDPFLVGLLSAVPLKSKLVSIVLGPWFVDI